MLKSIKKVISFCLCAGLILSIGVTAYAATAAETAYVYGFDYGDHVNTTAIAAQEQMYLNNLGYQTYCNTDVTASFAVGTSPSTGVSRMNSGVFAFNGHAGPGSCQFADASNGNDTFLTAKKSGTSGTYTYSKFESVDMSNCKAAFFFGCKTASTDRESTYGVLTTQAVSNGAKCSFGWTKSVDTTVATSYRERIFYFLRYGYAVKDAAANAASEMPWFDETRSYSIAGDGSVKLTLSRSGLGDTNQIDYETALQTISSNDYRLMDTLNDGTKVYVRYINEIPTLESIDVNEAEKMAYSTGISYDDADVQSISSMPLTVCEVPDYAVSDTLTDDGVMFTKTSDSTTLDVLCKIDNEIKLVRIIKTEYASENNETYQLNTKCFDLETGTEIDYMDIVNQLMK